MRYRNSYRVIKDMPVLHHGVWNLDSRIVVVKPPFDSEQPRPSLMCSQKFDIVLYLLLSRRRYQSVQAVSVVLLEEHCENCEILDFFQKMGMTKAGITP
jgi:hypothetical protein